METTHEYVEAALDDLSELIGASTIETQPQEHVLKTYLQLLVMHREGVPGENYEERLEELADDIEQLKSQIGMVEVLGAGAASAARRRNG